MKRTSFILGIAGLFLSSLAPAEASTLIDFETTGLGVPTVSGDPVGNDYSNLGVTFSDAFYHRCGGGCPAPSDGIFISSLNFHDSFTTSFINPVSDFSAINVSNSAFSATAFDGLGNSLGSAGASSFLQQISFNFDGIKSIVFSTDSQFGVDNFEFTPDVNSGVPEPSTWLMMLLGFGGIGLAMRKRRDASEGAPRVAGGRMLSRMA